MASPVKNNETRAGDISRFKRDMLLMLVGNALWGIGYNMYYGLLPVHMKSLGISEGMVGLIMSLMYFVGIFSFLSGFIAKRMNYKWMIFCSYMVTIPAPGLFIFAKAWGVFFIGQLTYSLSFLFNMAILLYILDYDSPGDKMGAYMKFGMANVITSMVAPTIGGWISSAQGTRAVFIYAAVFYTLSTLTFLLLTPSRKAARPDVAAAAPSARKKPRLRDVFTPKTILWLVLMGALPSIMVLTDPILSLFMQDRLMFTSDYIGYAYTVLAVGAASFMQLARKTTNRLDYRQTIFIALSLFLLSTASVFTGLKWVVLPLTLFRGASRFMMTYMAGTVAAQIDPENRNTLFGFYNSVRVLILFGVFNVGGQLYTLGVFTPFIVELIMVAAWMVIFYTTERRRAVN